MRRCSPRRTNPHATIASVAAAVPERSLDAARAADAARRCRKTSAGAIVRDSSTARCRSSRDRGFDYAEVTAGGVPLIGGRCATMQSRICAGLYLCGEILDVDGRIGGFNFQWAWASGRLAGISAST